MKPAARSGRVVLLGMFAIVLLIALPAFAYQYPLSSSDIRNAYLLGYAKDLNTTNFFAPYARQFPTPDSGPHIATITLKTPYGQLVELGQVRAECRRAGRRRGIREQEIAFSRASRVVDLMPPIPTRHPRIPPRQVRRFPIFSGISPRDSFKTARNFHRAATQVYLLYSDSSVNSYGVSGAIIEYRYDPEKIDPDDAATFEMHTPDGQDIETTFDLGRLR